MLNVTYFFKTVAIGTELISNIIYNNHKSVIGLVPEYGLEKKKEEEEARKLSEYKKLELGGLLWQAQLIKN